MKIASSLASLLALASLASATTAAGKDPIPGPAQKVKHPKIAKTTPGASYIKGRYFVELAEGATLDPVATLSASLNKASPGKYTGKHIREHTKIQSNLFSGVSVQLEKETDLEDLLKVKGVRKVYPVKINKRPTLVKTSKLAGGVPQDVTSHSQTGVDKIHASGHYGKGVKVAVIDTGVYWKHPALGGCFGKGCKISFGRDLVGDAYDADTNPTVVPDDDPMDNCSDSSHGTHTTGIIAANATGISKDGFKPFLPFLGVAPRATIGHYRIFGCNGNNGDDIMAQAIFRAFEDGAQVISISVGEAGVVRDESLSPRAIELVSRAGVHVVVSAGNDGAGGIGTIGDPAFAQSAYAVASVDNNRVVSSTFFGPKGEAYGYAAASNGAWKGSNNTAQILIADPTDGCAAKTYPVTGKVLLVRYNAQCKSGAICGSAAKQGAVGCLIYNVGAIGGSPLIPSASLDDLASADLLATLKATPNAVFTFTDKKALVNSPTGNTASAFTSYGTDAELHFKPDIAGIGGNVYSTISPFSAAGAGLTDAYTYESGTSMAAPTFAGTLALLIEARGELTVEKGKALMQNNAQKLKIYNTTLNENPIRLGAGLVNVSQAIAAKSMITPSALGLNDTVRTQKSYTLKLKNLGKNTVTYKLEHVGAALANSAEVGNDMPIPVINYTPDYATAEITPSKITLTGGKAVEFKVKFTPPKNANKKLLPFYGGYIKATPSDGSPSLTVPYAGFVGDFSKTKMIVEKNPVSGLVTGVYSEDSPITEGATLNATAGIDVKLVLGQGTRVVYAEVIKADSLPGVNPSLGVLVPTVPADAANTPYSIRVAAYKFNQPRNVQIEGQGNHVSYPIPWNGRVTPAPALGATDTPRQHGNNSIEYPLPDGKYQIRFSALKHFGDARKASDYEVVTSPSFELVH
ncbi:peptidase S8/S53 domain-containing protein [Fimicolochytrium jonesii]|uniref:peptidase S8/S53 domain-containing protein n=1 Tax=Fimicolochytrium jonesii TaxID=1396493 RepID=UPI0022FDCEA9|nr:peptidase S8/S53 domain-containing protein [Fimicolochytrium jonesii]KAI8824254.1 peptidase S8/S53 domain-containing protein [Fimicolochytrium jonesii]